MVKINKNEVGNLPVIIDFAVLMAVYNGDDPLLFERAIRSVLANNLLPNQFVLVVDGPINQILESVINIFIGERILEVYRNEVNVGLALALNYGLEKIRTKFVIRADADDFNLPDRFSSLIEEVNSNPMIDLIGSAILEVDKSGQVLFEKKVPLTKAEILKYIKLRNPFNHMSVLFRLSKVLSCGGYPNIHLKEDYALWCLMISQDAVVLNIPKILVHATTGNDMYKRRGGLIYALSELKMQLFIYRCKLTTIHFAFIVTILRAFVFLMPSYIRGSLYKLFLRR